MNTHHVIASEAKQPLSLHNVIANEAKQSLKEVGVSW